MFTTYGEPELPHEGARLRYMVSRNRQIRGVFNMYDEPESIQDDRIKRKRQIRGHV